MCPRRACLQRQRRLRRRKSEASQAENVEATGLWRWLLSCPYVFIKSFLRRSSDFGLGGKGFSGVRTLEILPVFYNEAHSTRFCTGNSAYNRRIIHRARDGMLS